MSGDDDTKNMVETVDVSPRGPDAPEAPGADVFRQLLHQAVRVADMANAQAMRMALDFAKVYEREQGVRGQFENQLKQMTLMEKQATRYAEDLAGMLRSERARWTRSGSRMRSYGARDCRGSAICCSRRRSRTARPERTSSESAGTSRRSLSGSVSQKG